MRDVWYAIGQENKFGIAQESSLGGHVEVDKDEVVLVIPFFVHDIVDTDVAVKNWNSRLRSRLMVC